MRGEILVQGEEREAKEELVRSSREVENRSKEECRGFSGEMMRREILTWVHMKRRQRGATRVQSKGSQRRGKQQGVEGASNELLEGDRK